MTLREFSLSLSAEERRRLAECRARWAMLPYIPEKEFADTMRWLYLLGYERGIARGYQDGYSTARETTQGLGL